MPEVTFSQVNVPVSVESTVVEVSLESADVKIELGQEPVIVKIEPVELVLPITGLDTGTSALQMVWGETPSGAIDGFNTDYTTANPYNPNQFAVFLNGIRQRIAADYTETSNRSFRFLNAPLPGDSLSIDYVQP